MLHPHRISMPSRNIFGHMRGGMSTCSLHVARKRHLIVCQAFPQVHSIRSSRRSRRQVISTSFIAILMPKSISLSAQEELHHEQALAHLVLAYHHFFFSGDSDLFYFCKPWHSDTRYCYSLVCYSLSRNSGGAIAEIEPFSH